MAITNTCFRFLLWAKSQGVLPEKTLTLGHLENETTPPIIDLLAKKYPGYFEKNKINWNETFADSLLAALGASESQSLDYSDFEKADLLYDLNEPLPAKLHNQFSLVIDGGTLEHIFNFPQAIKNCMHAIRINGHFIAFPPVNNLMGHGFYQFSPELFYRIFSNQNGFEVVKMFLVAAPFHLDTDIWYEVNDPALINERVILSGKNPAYMMILAKKLQDITFTTPQQSDYAFAWNNKHISETETKSNLGLLKSAYRKVFSEEKREQLRAIYKKLFRKGKEQEDLEKINNKFFKKFKA